VEAFTITVVLNDHTGEGLPTTHALIEGLKDGLPDDWFTAYGGDHYSIHTILEGTDVTCDFCIVMVDLDEQNHEFDAILCNAHTQQAREEAKAQRYIDDAPIGIE